MMNPIEKLKHSAGEIETTVEVNSVSESSVEKIPDIELLQRIYKRNKEIFDAHGLNEERAILYIAVNKCYDESKPIDTSKLNDIEWSPYAQSVSEAFEKYGAIAAYCTFANEFKMYMENHKFESEEDKKAVSLLYDHCVGFVDDLVNFAKYGL